MNVKVCLLIPGSRILNFTSFIFLYLFRCLDHCAARPNSPRFQSFANENENLSKVCQTFRLLQKKVRQAFQTCQTCRFSEFGSQSNTNSGSSKSTVFRIGTNQTHPKITPNFCDVPQSHRRNRLLRFVYAHSIHVINL